ncbi:hypothetical protein K7432_009634 [Basidiobolus ranarum]|uniref:(d)CMP kinase n=1 Tax=Basidiobolus ranarum TaxID=34480 RepID=A0ABR2WPX8_9FUNG
MFVAKRGILTFRGIQPRLFSTSNYLSTTHIVKVEAPLGIGSGTIARALAKKVEYQYIPVLEILKAIVFKATNKAPSYKHMMQPEKILNFIRDTEIECIYDPKLDYKIFVDRDDITAATLGLKPLAAITKRLQETPSVQKALLDRVARVICEHEAQGVVFSTYMTRLQTPCDVSIFLQADLETRMKLEMRRAKAKNLNIDLEKLRNGLIHHDKISKTFSTLDENTQILDISNMKLAHIVRKCEDIIKKSRS